MDWFRKKPPPVIDDDSDPSAARFATLSDLQAAGLTTGRGIPLGYLDEGGKAHRLHYAGENHLVTVGKPGSGKGTTAIIPTLLEHPGSVLVIDPKGQNAAITARRRVELGHEVYVLNPYGLHQTRFADLLPPSPEPPLRSGAIHIDRTGRVVEPEETPPQVAAVRYNPLAALDPQSENFVGDVRSLAEALIYSEGTKDPHWPDSARELVAALIMHVCRKPGEQATLGRVRELLTLPVVDEDDADGAEAGPPGFLELVVEMSCSDFAPLRQKAEQFVNVSKEIGSIISTARTQTAFLDDPAISDCLSGSSFSFADMKRRKITVYLILPAKHLEAQSRWLRLMVTSAIDNLIGEPQRGDQRALLIIDEFAQLGHLKSVEKAIALVRGYGLQLWLIVQDLNQLKHIYGERWQSFLATAGVHQIFAPNDRVTAEHVSNRAGEKLVRRRSISQQEVSEDQVKQGFTGISTSVSETWEPLLRPNALYGMPRSSQVLFLEGVASPILSKRRPYLDAASGYQGMFDPDPYHLA